MWGADSEELLRAVLRLEQQASTIELAERALTRRLRAAPWQGAAAERYRQRWEGFDRRQLAAAARCLRDAATDLRGHAAEQRQASQSGAGLSGGRVALPALGKGGTAGASDYLEEMTRLGPGQIGIRKVSDDPPRYVLMLRGLDISSLNPEDSNSWQSTLSEYRGVDSPYQTAIRRLLEERGVPADAEIAVMGHSQGGLAAMEFAAADSRVKQLVIMGSPVDAKTLPDHVRFADFIEADLDPVPRLDRADPIDRGWGSAFFGAVGGVVGGAYGVVAGSVVGGAIGGPVGAVTGGASGLVAGSAVGSEAAMRSVEQAAKWQEDVQPHGPGGGSKVLFSDPAAGDGVFDPHDMKSYLRAVRALEDDTQNASEIDFHGRADGVRSGLHIFNQSYGGGSSAGDVFVSDGATVRN
jgi:pimeloyl-ACP methyl ester carboxylesterase